MPGFLVGSHSQWNELGEIWEKICFTLPSLFWNGEYKVSFLDWTERENKVYTADSYKGSDVQGHFWVDS